MATLVRPSRQSSWDKRAENLLAATDFNIRAAAEIAREVARDERGTPLGVTAERTIAQLSAALYRSSPSTMRVARREFGALLHMLRDAQKKPFGKRGLSDDCRLQRQILRLPLAGPLTAADVNAAFRSAANSAHPDHGGSVDSFVALVTARNLLLERECK